MASLKELRARLETWKTKRARRKVKVKKWTRLHENSQKIVKRTKEKIRRKKVPGISHGWHPGAIRNQVHAGIGQFLGVPKRIVWHTTEGRSLPTYSGSHPHFTLNPHTGQLWQHIPIHSGAMTLKNAPGGVETNRAGALQVELIGFARDTHDWSREAYANIAKLARWLEKHGNVERRCGVDFTDSAGVRRLNAQAWLGYRGHLGHQHVPENDHWDPGRFRIDLVI